MAEKFLLHRFIVAPQIKRFEDLKGKRVAISGFGTLTDMLTREILIDRGLKPMQDVMLLQTGGVAVRLAALLSNNVQAALLSSQQALAALQAGYGNLDYDPPPYLSHPLIAKNELLGNRKRSRARCFEGRSRGIYFSAKSRRKRSTSFIRYCVLTIAKWREKPMKMRCAGTIPAGDSSRAT